MRRFVLLLVITGIAPVLFPTAGSAVNCPGQPANLVDVAMIWCGGDHGFNEGATCGLNALSGAGLSGLPAMAAAPILGNTWDRTNMMGATKAAAHAGQMDAAVEAAICCQIHNPGVYNCLQGNKSEVASWLASH